MKSFNQFLKEDGPDSPYSTPANFNHANVRKSTHAQTTPDVPDRKEEKKQGKGRFLTVDEARAAYREGVRDGSIGKCPHCGSPNLGGLLPTDFESRKCIDCGKVSDKWRVQLKDDMNFPGDHVDVNPSKKTSDVDFPRY